MTKLNLGQIFTRGILARGRRGIFDHYRPYKGEPYIKHFHWILCMAAWNSHGRKFPQNWKGLDSRIQNRKGCRFQRGENVLWTCDKRYIPWKSLTLLKKAWFPPNLVVLVILGILWKCNYGTQSICTLSGQTQVVLFLCFFPAKIWGREKSTIIHMHFVQ